MLSAKCEVRLWVPPCDGNSVKEGTVGGMFNDTIVNCQMYLPEILHTIFVPDLSRCDQ